MGALFAGHLMGIVVCVLNGTGKSTLGIDVPKGIQIQQARNRSFQKFGNRMLPGGDLYEQEEGFFSANIKKIIIKGYAFCCKQSVSF